MQLLELGRVIYADMEKTTKIYFPKEIKAQVACV